MDHSSSSDSSSSDSSSSSSSSSSNDNTAVKTRKLVAISLPLVQHRLSLLRQQEAESSYRPHGGSKKGRKCKNRQYEATLARVHANYFGANPIFRDHDFRYRFRIGKFGINPKIKVIAAIRMLAYGTAADLVDDMLHVAEPTVHECMRYFCDGIIRIFGGEYLRKPNAVDIQRLFKESEERRWPRMLGSIDCMHWQCKNCPSAWQGSHTGHKHKPTVILEAVADRDAWIWHAFFGMAGSHNDLNVLDRSPIFDDIVNDEAIPCNYTVNGHHYDMGYYLADGIYPNYATLIQTIAKLTIAQDKHFAKKQEAARKDIERVFGILQSHWSILANLCRLWYLENMATVMRASIILHNMIVEDERKMDIPQYILDLEIPSREGASEDQRQFVLSRWASGIERVGSKVVHDRLKNDLVEHLGSRRT